MAQAIPQLRKMVPQYDSLVNQTPMHLALPVPTQSSIPASPLMLNGGGLESDPARVGMPAVNVPAGGYQIDPMQQQAAPGPLTNPLHSAALDALNNSKPTVLGRFMKDFTQGQQLFGSLIGPLVGLSSPFGGAAGANQAVKDIETIAKQRADAQLSAQQGASTVMNSIANMMNIADPTANNIYKSLITQQGLNQRAQAMMDYRKDRQAHQEEVDQNKIQLAVDEFKLKQEIERANQEQDQAVRERMLAQTAKDAADIKERHRYNSILEKNFAAATAAKYVGYGIDEAKIAADDANEAAARELKRQMRIADILGTAHTPVSAAGEIVPKSANFGKQGEYLGPANPMDILKQSGLVPSAMPTQGIDPASFAKAGNKEQFGQWAIQNNIPPKLRASLWTEWGGK